MFWSKLVRFVCIGLVATLALQAPIARAEMIGADASVTVPASPEEQQRQKVKDFLKNAALQERLRTLGVDGLSAAARVEAMTQAEVHALAEKIDAMPAGGQMSSNDWILILLVAILLIVAL
jgi:hypothetical protein